MSKTVCGWSLGDVYEQAESLEIKISEEEANFILGRFEKKFDASDGFTLICNLLENLRDNKEPQQIKCLDCGRYDSIENFASNGNLLYCPACGSFEVEKY